MFPYNRRYQFIFNYYQSFKSLIIANKKLSSVTGLKIIDLGDADYIQDT